MTYSETIDYLYQLLPVFHRIGKKAFKANLDNTLTLCSHLDNPQHKFKSVHVAGTNGKGSSSHLLASIFQSAGFKTGLYTSPHLKSFTERIKIDGQAIPENKVVQFVTENQQLIEDIKPSFFELTVGLAFKYFADEQVDIAIVEVGLGGRLDSTNVITPELSLITNISFDHTDILGDTLPKIASEKAGIIKPQVPVVVSERNDATQKVFIDKASLESSPIFFAEDLYQVMDTKLIESRLEIEVFDKVKNETFKIASALIGSYQKKNIIGVLAAIHVLRNHGFSISDEQIRHGISSVLKNTSLKGRWQQLGTEPDIFCDTAHNIGGFLEILSNINNYPFQQLWFVLGFVADKDIDGILKLLPTNANYIFCQCDSPRALNSQTLAERAKLFSLQGEIKSNVNEAIAYAKSKAGVNDFIYVGGSTFVVAEIENL